MSLIIAFIAVSLLAAVFYWAGKNSTGINLVKKQLDNAVDNGIKSTLELAETIRIKRDLEKENQQLLGELNKTTEVLEKTINQKKSSEVKTGQIVEQLAPFLDGFNYDPKCARFLGNPIDFVLFLNDRVVFLEVKSGDSQLSTSQRLIRDLIKEGKVSFEVLRIKGK